MDINENLIRKIVLEELNKKTDEIALAFNNENIKKVKKEKRPPNKWNIFLGECSKRQPKDKTMGEKAKACSVEYHKSIKNGIFKDDKDDKNKDEVVI